MRAILNFLTIVAVSIILTKSVYACDTTIEHCHINSPTDTAECLPCPNEEMTHEEYVYHRLKDVMYERQEALKAAKELVRQAEAYRDMIIEQQNKTKKPLDIAPSTML